MRIDSVNSRPQSFGALKIATGVRKELYKALAEECGDNISFATALFAKLASVKEKQFYNPLDLRIYSVDDSRSSTRQRFFTELGDCSSNGDSWIPGEKSNMVNSAESFFQWLEDASNFATNRAKTLEILKGILPKT